MIIDSRDCQIANKAEMAAVVRRSATSIVPSRHRQKQQPDYSVASRKLGLTINPAPALPKQ
jgi:hypothetical protein